MKKKKKRKKNILFEESRFGGKRAKPSEIAGKIALFGLWTVILLS